jgi:hypothetical protein
MFVDKKRSSRVCIIMYIHSPPPPKSVHVDFKMDVVGIRL